MSEINEAEKYYRRIANVVPGAPAVEFFEVLGVPRTDAAAPVCAVTPDLLADTPLVQGSELAERYYRKIVKDTTQLKVIKHRIPNVCLHTC